MRYGGSDSLTLGKCPRCSESIDKHAIPFIESTPESLILCNHLLNALENVSKRGLELGKAKSTVTMAGSLITTVGSDKRKYVTASGPGVGTLQKIKKVLGKDVILVTDGNVSTATNTKITDIFGVEFTPVALAGNNTIRKPCGDSYPLGDCAAQKLLVTVFRYAKSIKQKVRKLEMTEIYWKDVQQTAHNRKWSTQVAAQSCDTCKRVLPQMLCSHVE
ncbi:MAG: hypothetical protein WCA20_11375 [Candidatus Sulfotelmatobacter sp.]